MKKTIIAGCLSCWLTAGTVAYAEYELEPHYWGTIGQYAPLDYYVVAVDVSPNGNIYLVDLFHDYIRIIAPDGTLVSEFPSVDLWPRGVAADAEGNSYVADANGSRIRKYSPTGEVLLEFGSSGNQPGQFDYPRAIEFDSDNHLIVADRTTQITAFDTDGTVIWNNMATVVAEGDLISPQGLALDADDNIFVVDTSKRSVLVYDSTGTYLRAWGPQGTGWRLRAPVSVTIGQNGNVYVLDRAQNLTHVGEDLVKVFDPQGQFLFSFGPKGRAPYNLWEPQGISTGTDGSIWVAGFQGHNVVRYDQDGNPLGELNDHNPTPAEFAQAQAASVGNDGRLYVADFWNHLVQVFDRYGNFLEMWGERGQGDGQVFNFPKQSTTDPAGNLYVSDDGWVRKFAPDGQFLARFSPGASSYPGGLEVDDAGNLWVSVSGNNTIVRYNQSLVIDLSLTASSFPGGMDRPYNIRQAPNGMMYFTDTYNHRIIRMDQNGNYDMEWGSFGDDPGEFRSPVGMEIDSEGRVYVSETWAKRLQVFSEDGMLLTGWDLPGIAGKLPARVFELALDGDYFLYAPDHTFGQAEVHKYALIPSADVAGEPVMPAEELTASIWSDDGRLWHLRWQADGVNREFSGKIHSTSGIEEVWATATVPVTASIEQVSDQMAIFSAMHATEVSGVDVLVSGEGIITFEFEVDDELRADIVQVGANGFVPNSLPLPFTTPGGLSTIDPVGMPNYTPAGDLGYYLWRDEEAHDWRLWWSGDSVVNTNYSGTVSSTQDFIEVTPVNFNADDSLIATSNEFTFTAVAGAGQDGVRFSVPDGSTLTFDLQIEGIDDTQRVFIGSAGTHPDAIPFMLISLPIGPPADTDGDSIADWQDNCTEIANPSQCDSNQDGFGNACDGDLDDSGHTNFADLVIFRDSFLTTTGDPAYNADADLDCNGSVNFPDVAVFKDLFLLPPGPSGVAP